LRWCEFHGREMGEDAVGGGMGLTPASCDSSGDSLVERETGSDRTSSLGLCGGGGQMSTALWQGAMAEIEEAQRWSE
jgi:hypothetical protein